MACVILKCYRATLQSGEVIELYSTTDLTALDSTLRYAVSIERVDKAGLGTDGPVIQARTAELVEIIPTDRVTSKCSMVEVDRILLAHKQARKVLASRLQSE